MIAIDAILMNSLAQSMRNGARTLQVAYSIVASLEFLSVVDVKLWSLEC